MINNNVLVVESRSCCNSAGSLLPIIWAVAGGVHILPVKEPIWGLHRDM